MKINIEDYQDLDSVHMEKIKRAKPKSSITTVKRRKIKHHKNKPKYIDEI